MKKLTLFLTGLFAVIALATLTLNLPKANATTCSGGCPPPPPAPQTVKICHGNDDVNNPYVTESPNIKNDGSLDGGHLNDIGPLASSLSIAQALKNSHPKIQWGDIIPPYVSGTFNYPGLNWTTYGQAMLNNNCKYVTPVCTDPTATNYVANPSSAQVSDNTTCTYTPAGTCPTKCGQPASRVPNGKGGFISCDETPVCITDQCPNLEGVQASVPDGYVKNTDGMCVKQCDKDEDHTEDDDQDDNDCVTPTVSPTVTPTPTATPTANPTPTQTPSNPGGPGDGRSDGRSDGGSSCPSCTQAPQTQVLGASTGPVQAVLGASTMAGTGTFENNLMNFMLVLGTIILGAGIKSYAKEKNS